MGTDIMGREDPNLGDVVVGRDAIKHKVAELGRRITADYRGRSVLLVGILKGAWMFLADLVREIEAPVEIDFMAVSSYGSTTRTSGVVRIIKDLEQDITGREILLVEDILDSGLTLSYLRKTLLARGPASLEICTLLARDEQPELEEMVRYTGFRIPAGWVVGYGLDVAEQYRNLPDIVWYTGPR